MRRLLFSSSRFFDNNIVSYFVSACVCVFDCICVYALDYMCTHTHVCVYIVVEGKKKYWGTDYWFKYSHYFLLPPLYWDTIDITQV